MTGWPTIKSGTSEAFDDISTLITVEENNFIVRWGLSSFTQLLHRLASAAEIVLWHGSPLQALYYQAINFAYKGQVNT